MCSVAFGVRPAARFETCKPNMFGASHAAILCLVLCTEAKVVLSMGETVRLASDYTESEEVYVVHSHVPCTVWKSASKPCCSNRLQAGWRPSLMALWLKSTAGVRPLSSSGERYTLPADLFRWSRVKATRALTTVSALESAHPVALGYGT